MLLDTSRASRNKAIDDVTMYRSSSTGSVFFVLVVGQRMRQVPEVQAFKQRAGGRARSMAMGEKLREAARSAKFAWRDRNRGGRSRVESMNYSFLPFSGVVHVNLPPL